MRLTFLGAAREVTGSCYLMRRGRIARDIEMRTLTAWQKQHRANRPRAEAYLRRARRVGHGGRLRPPGA